MFPLVLSAFSSSNHAADDGGIDHEEGINCSHGVPTRGTPCSTCLEAATKLVAPPILPSEPANITPVANVIRHHGPIEASRLWSALGPPTGGHQDLGLYD